MEFLQFLNDVAGTDRDDYSLAYGNVIDIFVALSNWLNPFWWFGNDDDDKWDVMYE